jgi:hypothetical protein
MNADELISGERVIKDYKSVIYGKMIILAQDSFFWQGKTY